MTFHVWKDFILFLNAIDSFTGYRIIICKCFSFRILRKILHYRLNSGVTIKKPDTILIFVYFLKCNFFFLLWTHLELFLSGEEKFLEDMPSCCYLWYLAVDRPTNSRDLYILQFHILFKNFLGRLVSIISPVLSF